MKNVYICGEFNTPHIIAHIHCTYHTENSDKILETIETGTFKLLNNGFHTYQSHQAECRNKLDLNFTDQSVIKFFDTFYVSDDFGSDHSSTITTLNIVIQNTLHLKVKNNFKKFNQTVTQESENTVLYPPVYPKTKLHQFNEILVQIIQCSLQKLYILQKRFLFGHENTKLIREKKKKRRELKRTNGEQYKPLKKEINFLQRKEVHEEIGKNKQSKLIARAQNKGSKIFWKAFKALCGDSKITIETEQSVEVSYRQLRATTDIGNCEIFKTLLQDTKKIIKKKAWK